MLPSRLWNDLQMMTQEQALIEILELNERTRQYGLALTPEEAKQVMVARDEALLGTGRVELDIEVSKSLIDRFASSPFMRAEDYVFVLMELHELFYHLKNETEDRINDVKLIDMMRERFDRECGGSMDMLKSVMEEYAEQFRNEMAFELHWTEGGDDE